ncbi:MAG TPA: carboxypeptidase-like regulatory domain-containing protein [Terriglobia bacterium]|nr:carboxypeptidase-like regulatory domain-containing protein [Terriglobia bacterium]
MASRLWWICGLLFFAANLCGQVDRGSLRGTVHDSSGLVVPGVPVMASQDATGLKRSTKTSQSGTFSIPELPVGMYTVTVALQGFETVKFESLEVGVEHTTTLNVELRVSSAATERVEVVGSSQQLDENSNTLGARIEHTQVQELLLNGRNWSTLTALAPLAVDTNYNSSSNQRSIRVAGRGRDDNNFTLDGVDATNIINQAQQPYVRLAIPLDTIQEFRVVSMLATAENGATAGGQMTVTSASGSNQFHGGAFDFVRNDIFDSRSFIDITKPPFRLNQFGGSLGGPVIRNRTFFFGSYEGYRQILGQTLVGFVPTDAFRQQVAAQSPPLVPVLNAYPAGTLPVTGNPDAAEYVGYGRQLGNEDSGMMRVDHSFSDKTTAFVRLNIDRAVSNVPLASSGQYLADRQVLNSSPENGAVEVMHVFSSGLINEAKFGFNRSTAITTNANQTATLYAFSVPGFTTLNNDRISTGVGNTFAGIDNLTVVKGRHVLKAGAEIRRIQMNQGKTASGTVSFSSMSAFAANQVNTAKYTEAEPTNGLRKFTYSGYMQDEFKWRPDFTLNIGARYSFFNIFHEVYDRPNPFDFNTCGPAGFCGVGASFGQPTYRDLDPRIALAWAPSSLGGRTVIRAGFGTYHQDGQLDDQNVPEGNEVASYSLSRKTIPDLTYPIEPFLSEVSGVISPSAMDRRRKDMYVTQWGLSVQHALPDSLLGTISYVGSKGTHLLTLSYVNVLNPLTGLPPYPLFGQISWRGNQSNSTYEGLGLGLRRAFRQGLLLSMNYTWSHEIDDGSMGSGDGDSLTPQIVECRACDKANGIWDVRHAANASIVYELPFGAGKPFLNQGGFSRGVFGSWQITSIISAHSGFPINITADRPSTAVPDGNTNDQRPDRVPGVSLIPPGGVTPAEWINPAAFAVPAPGTFGNAGRDIGVAPHIWQVDFGASKRITLTERYQLQFRAEAFNIFNRDQFGAPLSDFSAGPGEFGLITQPVNTTPIGGGTPRQIQLALRLEF